MSKQVWTSLVEPLPRHSGKDHLKVYNNLRAAAKATGRNVAALVDLQGPKIRCGWFKKNADGEDKVQLTEGQEFVITTDDIEGDEHITSTTFKGLPGDCHEAIRLLIDDGKVRLEVTKVEATTCTPRLSLPDRSPATRASTFRASPCLCRL